MLARLLHLQGAAAAAVAVLVLILSMTLMSSSFAHHARAVSARCCVASECEALISFKKSYTDHNRLLSSWQGEDCCGWKGVRGNNQTGHVIKLDLRGPDHAAMSRGQIWNPTIIAALPHLRYLDLSFNDFNCSTSKHLSFLGALNNLRYLNLSNVGFPGSKPWQLGNLSRLQHLDLSSFNDIPVSDLTWLPHLSSLKSLSMIRFNLRSASDWVSKVNMLPNLKTLDLSWCLLSRETSRLSHYSNLTHLEILDLSHIQFNSFLQHNWFWDVTTIKELYLSYCGWYGPIPGALGNMSSLEVLDIGWNSISGIAPTTLEKLCSLQVLSLEHISINADAEMIGRLPSKLRELYLGSANLNGQLPTSIGNLTSLSFLDLSSNMLGGSIPSEIGNMRCLSYLDLSFNMLHGDVPSGIGALSNLTYLILGNNNFSGVLSKEHFASLVNLEYLDTENTSLKLDFGEDWVPPFRLRYGSFGSCDMGPQFPAWLRWQMGIHDLDISNTKINDVLPHWFWVAFPNASRLNMSGNKLSGTLPPKLELPLLESMDLSGNSLSGKLPYLTAAYPYRMDLSNNHFTGTIPAPYVCNVVWEINLSNNQLTGGFPHCQSNESSSDLSMLDLRNNNLSGEFPHFLQYAASLSFLDLSYNRFSGSVPIWIAEKMPSLEVLILRSNMFHGHLPRQLSRIVGLHYLDVAQNNISGTIPSSLEGLTAMADPLFLDYYDHIDNAFSVTISTFIKNRELNYTHEFTKYTVRTHVRFGMVSD